MLSQNNPNTNIYIRLGMNTIRIYTWLGKIHRAVIDYSQIILSKVCCFSPVNLWQPSLKKEKSAAVHSSCCPFPLFHILRSHENVKRARRKKTRHSLISDFFSSFAPGPTVRKMGAWYIFSSPPLLLTRSQTILCPGYEITLKSKSARNFWLFPHCISPGKKNTNETMHR